MKTHRSASQAALWTIAAAVLAFLYLPLFPPLLLSFSPEGQGLQAGGFTLRWYREMWEQPILTSSFKTSLVAAAIVGLVTPLLALLAAMAVREFRSRRIIVLLLVLPLFVPAVTMGLSTAFFFQRLGLPPSLITIVLVHVIWALPFAFLITLAVMATFNPLYLEAAYLSGAGRWRAFMDVELPLIFPGIFGASIFSVILSFNETIRTTMVQGPLNTVQTYIWSTFLQVGLSPTLYALMGLLVILTFGLVVVMILLGFARKN
ncbi:MAG: ABC transporter permease subunit [Kiloniellales bacterium]|nr:ABC transporter permease subunit [Kiloniellales bacterium]